jgi:hypothetical protein
MRKLPETGLQFIREFEEEEGAFIAFAGFGFTPDDETIDRHPTEPAPRVHVDEEHGKLGADGELPSRRETHATFRNVEVTGTTGLGIGAVIQIKRGA